MAQYYTVILTVNILFTVFFYFKVRNSGISPKAFLFITGLSMALGIFFPLLAGYFQTYVVIGIYLFVTGLAAYFIAGREGNSVLASLPGAFVEEYLPVPETLIPAGEIELPEEVELVIDSEEAGEGLDEPVDAPVVEPDEELQLADEIITVEEIQELILREVAVSLEASELPEGDDINETQADFIHRDSLSGSSNDLQGENIMSVVEQLQDNSDLRNSFIVRGFDAKAEGKLELAVKYFTAALELDSPPDLEIMLIFDICAMLKETGQYQKTRESLEQFKSQKTNLPPAAVWEIEIQLKYLEILQETLKKVKTPSMPFAMIPVLIKVSVEEKVNQWKNDIF